MAELNTSEIEAVGGGLIMPFASKNGQVILRVGGEFIWGFYVGFVSAF